MDVNAPPGFGAPKHNEIVDGSSRSNVSGYGKRHASSSEIDSDRRRPKSVKYFITPIREWCEVWLKERRLWPKPYMTKIQKRCW